MPDWAISIAFSDGNSITHGVIHAPDLNLTAWAIKGSGCFINGRQITFDNAASPSPIVAIGAIPPGARGQSTLIGLKDYWMLASSTVATGPLQFVFSACWRAGSMRFTNPH